MKAFANVYECLCEYDQRIQDKSLQIVRMHLLKNAIEGPGAAFHILYGVKSVAEAMTWIGESVST